MTNFSTYPIRVEFCLNSGYGWDWLLDMGVVLQEHFLKVPEVWLELDPVAVQNESDDKSRVLVPTHSLLWTKTMYIWEDKQLNWAFWTTRSYSHICITYFCSTYMVEQNFNRPRDLVPWDHGACWGRGPRGPSFCSNQRVRKCWISFEIEVRRTIFQIGKRKVFLKIHSSWNKPNFSLSDSKAADCL